MAPGGGCSLQPLPIHVGGVASLLFFSVSIILSLLFSTLPSSWFTIEFTKPTGTIVLGPSTGTFKYGVCVAGSITLDFLFQGS
jgi:hypothetical protein